MNIKRYRIGHCYPNSPLPYVVQRRSPWWCFFTPWTSVGFAQNLGDAYSMAEKDSLQRHPGWVYKSWYR